MKTETKTIKCWANWYPNNTTEEAHNVSIHAFEHIARKDCDDKGITVPCTITLELPVEEKEAVISDRRIDELHSEWFKGGSGQYFSEFLKDKLFGGG